MNNLSLLNNLLNHLHPTKIVHIGISELFKISKRIYYKIVFFYNLSIFFDFLLVDVQENLDEREFKIDKVKAILLLPINWIGINYANDKKYDQKLQDDAKLEIDIINNEIISLLIDDPVEMPDQCMNPYS